MNQIIHHMLATALFGGGFAVAVWSLGQSVRRGADWMRRNGPNGSADFNDIVREEGE